MFDWMTGYLEQNGYVGIFFLMFAENLFPPIPSELIMPLAGFTAAHGRLNIILVILSGSSGSLLGAVFWYYIGLWIGSQRLKDCAARYGRWLTVTPQEVDHATRWFRRHGAKAVFIGRLIPAVRTLISIPAGISKMTLIRLLVYSALGTILWTTFLAMAGYVLESQYRTVAEWVNPVSNVVIGLLGFWYVYRVATFGWRSSVR